VGGKAHYFEAGTGPLLGTLHAPVTMRPRSGGVILCNPFGEEAARAHRLFRVLAGRLESSGYWTMRFDYSGTGDSSGEDDEATLDGWLTDVAAAAEALQRASRARRLALVGLRLGATLAALACTRGLVQARHLLLWDPVVEGASYLREQAAAHRTYMQSELRTWKDRLQLSPEGFPAEALGTRIPPALATALAALDLSHEEIPADLLTVFSTGPAPGLDRMRQQLLPRSTARWIDMPASQAWNSDAALNAAVVPAAVLSALAERIEETIP